MIHKIFNSDDSSSDFNDEEKPGNEKVSNLLTCGPDVMRPTNDDKDAVAIRYKKKKKKIIKKCNVHFEPEKYEAALRSILGMSLISSYIIVTFTNFIIFRF